jgi:YHS domain-containing protein
MGRFDHYRTMSKIWMIAFSVFMTLSGISQPGSKLYNLTDGKALSGYDPVCYFTLGKAIKGSKDFLYVYQGVTYYFASDTDRESFRRSPDKYIPQYGGWCAYAMGHDGSKVEVDPETFKMIDGKLYLFYNRFFNNTLKSWNRDEIQLRRQADSNWEKINHS